MQQKWFQKGSLEQYRPTSRKKKNLLNNLNLYLKELEKDKEKEILKIRIKLNEIKMKKLEKINETQSWLFKKKKRKL